MPTAVRKCHRKMRVSTRVSSASFRPLRLHPKMLGPARDSAWRHEYRTTLSAMIKVQNVSGHAVDLHIGVLAPGEVAEVESNRGLVPMIESGVLVELEDEKPKKGDAK